MSIERLPAELRVKDYFHHIDMSFLNRRLAITALPPGVRDHYIERAKPGTDHMTVLANDHLLVTMLLDVCEAVHAPTLLEALTEGKPRLLFKSTEHLAACPDVYTSHRVVHDVELPIELGKPVRIAYHTEHLVSSTGTMTLGGGTKEGYVHSIVGLLHDKRDGYEIEPIVVGSPWFDHPRNGDASSTLMWFGRDIGEILPEDIDQFARMRDVVVESADAWMSVMQLLPEERVKSAFATLLREPAKKDWGGENNDHFSANVSLNGVRKTAAFLFKGPAAFREMTLDVCGKRADQLYRLSKSGAEVSIVQHCHVIGEVVRTTLRALTIFPGYPRKYCFIDGQGTYRILKAYGLVTNP